MRHACLFIRCVTRMAQSCRAHAGITKGATL